MKRFLNRKYLILATLVFLTVLYYLIRGFFGKVDDWQYFHISSKAWETLIFYLVGLMLFSWLAISIYLIVVGKKNEKGINVKRRLGIWSLITPFLIIGLVVGFIAIHFPLGFLFMLILLLVVIVYTSFYISKHKVWPAYISLILVPMIVIGLFGITVPSFTKYIRKSKSSGIPRLGFSVGGAKDINNFRQNIENKYLPLPTDITHEGLFYEYYFDTGEQKVCQKLFCPSYSFAVSKDPLSHKKEYYLQVGLNSGIKQKEFKRKKLNLVVILDISGSMSSSFYSYYYDMYGRRVGREIEEDIDSNKSKMQIANKSVVGLLKHLNDDDRFGMVLFDNRAYLAKPIRKVADTDMNAINGHIMDLTPRGGTNMYAGMKMGSDLFEEFMDSDKDEYENRIIFLTDAMPNTGYTQTDDFLQLSEKNAKKKIFTTFIGIGVDFNTELVEQITKIRGANYYSVHSAREFKNRMDDEFEFMVTPLVFNLLLALDAKGFKIEKVYGSPEAHEATGEIMKINTLFPSKKDEGETKGGIVILKLKKLSNNAELKLKTSYEKRNGKAEGEEIIVKMPDLEKEYYANNGIRKGILLSRYVNLMRIWIDDERNINNPENENPFVMYDEGILVPQDIKPAMLGEWERQSSKLTVSKEYRMIFELFKKHLKSEKNELNDETLSKEIIILNKLLDNKEDKKS